MFVLRFERLIVLLLAVSFASFAVAGIPKPQGCDDYWPDNDGDGYGAGASTSFCENPGPGWATNDLDCDDSDPHIHPGALEIIADGKDQDCDGAEICYQDNDNDGWRTDETVISIDISCTGPGLALASLQSGDCDDSDPDVNPGATEICDSIDNNCNFQVDCDDPSCVDCDQVDCSDCSLLDGVFWDRFQIFTAQKSRACHSNLSL